MDGRLEDLRNLGPSACRRLRSVGIETPSHLRRAGAVEAFRRLAERDPDDAPIELLYALEGALLDLPWDRLSPDVIRSLRTRALGAC